MDKKLKDNIIILLLIYIAIVVSISAFRKNNGSNTGNVISKTDTHRAQPEPLSNAATVDNLKEKKDSSNIDNNRPIPDPIAGKPKTSIHFQHTDYDFGNIKQDSQHKHTFVFTNTGKNPLIIANAKASCGCTVPDYPKQPIAPGKQSQIDVIYSPGKQRGQTHKTVTITANTDPSTTVLSISANVEVKK